MLTWTNESERIFNSTEKVYLQNKLKIFTYQTKKNPSNSYLLFHSIQHQKDESANKESKKSLGSLSGDASAEEDASILEELAMISRINHPQSSNDEQGKVINFTKKIRKILFIFT